jgi:hypothetical protein
MAAEENECVRVRVNGQNAVAYWGGGKGVYPASCVHSLAFVPVRRARSVVYSRAAGGGGRKWRATGK